MIDLVSRAGSPPSAGAQERLRDILRGLATHPAAHALAVPSLFLALTLVVRAFAFDVSVIDTDEGLYLLQAREWLRGGWPYVAVWDMHPVGGPAMFAVAWILFGKSIVTIRLLGALCVAATAFLAYRTVRALHGPRVVGLAAGILYIAHSVLLGGLASNTEILFAPLVSGAMYLGTRAAVRATESGEAPRWRDLVLMGALIGYALAVKPVVTPMGCLAFLLMVVPAWWGGALPLRRVLAFALAYAALCALPTVLFGIAYALHGDFQAFLYGSFLAPLAYAGGAVSAAQAWSRICDAAGDLILPFLLAIAALVGLRGRSLKDPATLLVAIALMWFVAASLAVAGPGMYFNHYFVIWLAPLSILAAVGAWKLAWTLRPGLAWPVFVGLVGAVAIHAWATDTLPRLERGWDAPDPPRQVANIIAQQIRRGEPIFIANYHPAVYVMSGAGVPTRFAFPGHLTCAFDKLTGIDADAEVNRILANRPRIIVVDRGWWGSMRRRVRVNIATALRRSYVKVAEVQEIAGPVEIWRRL
jgi:4-amino-4-deoxy-L-arabinose transferase-like glycosyltransferase